jgi:hypothetical protein
VSCSRRTRRQRGANGGSGTPAPPQVPRDAPHDLRGLRAAGPRLALGVSADLQEWRRLGPVQFAWRTSTPTCACSPTKTRCSSRARADPTASRPSPCCTARVGPRWFPGGETAPRRRHRRGGPGSGSPTSQSRRCVGHPALVRPGPPLHRPVRAPAERATAPGRPDARRRGLAADPPRGHRRTPMGLNPTTQRVDTQRSDAARRRPSRVLARTAEPIRPRRRTTSGPARCNVVFPTTVRVDGSYVFTDDRLHRRGAARPGPHHGLPRRRPVGACACPCPPRCPGGADPDVAGDRPPRPLRTFAHLDFHRHAGTLARRPVFAEPVATCQPDRPLGVSDVRQPA